MEIVPFAGWDNNARIVLNDVEMIVTLEVGPRILRYGFMDGPNVMAVHEAEAGIVGGDEFHGFGGHRLWIAPEETERTCQPDNDPVDYAIVDGVHVFASKADKFHTQKEIRIRPNDETGAFEIEHRIYNHSPYELELAPWAPTQCAGGEVIFPQPAFKSHADEVLPARPLVMWAYTDMTDSRWTWGKHVIRFRHDPTKGPNKIGAFVDQGYAACVYEGSTFLKRFAADLDAPYPDYNCNFETFSRQDMLEIESLGPMQFVPAHGYCSHVERWYLVRATAPSGDAECGAWLQNIAESRP